MGAFSCPHLDLEKDRCTRMGAECVPGRRGCVLRDRGGFIWPAEQRVREREEASSVLARALDALLKPATVDESA